MGDKFIFDVPASVSAIDKILMIAESFKSEEGFIGELATTLTALKGLINLPDYISLLNERLITCRNFNGLKLERAWDGGFQNFQERDNVIRLHRLALYFSIYLKELSFRQNFRIDEHHDLYKLISLVRNNRHEFIERSEWCLNLLDDLPTLIMQEEFHSEHAIALSRAIKSTDISKVEDFIRTREETISKIDTWNQDFENKKSAIEILKNKLDTYETAFNFVGLYQGFSQLKVKKDKELWWLNIQYFILVFLMIAVPTSEFFWLFNNFSNDIKAIKLIVLALPSLTLLLVLFWFFRIILQNIKSIRSQIMQLELRMTLCQFIQSYAEKSKELKEHNKEGFEKFENLIFSSIVSSDEKIPSTFDGMEHVSSLLKNFKTGS